MAVAIPAGFNKGFAITPSDTVDFPFTVGMGRTPDAIIATGTQGVAVLVAQDGSVFNVSTAAGIPFMTQNVRRVMATNTTATNLTALYIV